MAKLIKTKAHPRFGATKVQAKRNQELRDRDNKIFELEQVLAMERLAVKQRLEVVMSAAEAEEDRLKLVIRDLKLKIPADRPPELPEIEMTRQLDQIDAWVTKGKYEALLEAFRILASGKVTP